ncbi:MAG TPA: LuxR C-terminal-related transcriptional regulator [Dehalococcoidia bacterium]
MVTTESERGRLLLEAGRWSEARAAFEAALGEDPAPEVLHGLAEALQWTGDMQASIAGYQRAYAAYRRRGNPLGAAWAAITLAISYKCCLGNEAAARGWLGRAETAAGEGDPAPVRGWLSCIRGYLEMDQDLQRAGRLMEQGLAEARATGDRDLELIALGDLGVVLVRSGRTEEGLRLVDEAMAGLTAGEHQRLDTVVWVCCIMLLACQAAADLARASQWIRVAEQFLQDYGCPYLYAECRAIYGSILLVNGRWTEAEQHLTAALRLTEGVYPAVYRTAAAGLATLRLRQGRLEEARQALAGVEQDVERAPVAAALELACGGPSRAVTLLERVLRSSDAGSLAAVRALELLVEAHLAAGDRTAAGEALSRLGATARGTRGPEAAARAGMAAGRLAAAEGDPAAALVQFERAIAAFERLNMPYEAAQARLALAAAAGETNPDLAVVEAECALRAFRELGALAGADAAAALLRGLGVPTRSGPKGLGLLTLREREVLRLLSNGLSNPEIAERLVISRKTVAHHVSSVLAKLGVRNRAEAVAYAARGGAGGPL